MGVSKKASSLLDLDARRPRGVQPAVEPCIELRPGRHARPQQFRNRPMPTQRIVRGPRPHQARGQLRHRGHVGRPRLLDIVSPRLPLTGRQRRAGGFQSLLRVGEVVDGGGARRRCAIPPASARRAGDVALGRGEGGIGGLLPIAGLRVCCACSQAGGGSRRGSPSSGRRLRPRWAACSASRVAVSSVAISPSHRT